MIIAFDKCDETPNNRIWHHGLIGENGFKSNFTREQLVEILFPFFQNNVLFKNVFCSFVFHYELASVKGIADVIDCIDSGNQYPVYDFEEAFSQNFDDDKDIASLIDRIKLVYDCCDSSAVKWFLNQIFDNKVVDFINSNFRYYPLIWVNYLREKDVLDYFYDDEEDNDDTIVDHLPIIGDQRAFLLGEVDLSLFEPPHDLDVFSISIPPYSHICDYIPMYFPQESYCTFLLEDGNIILTKKVGYECNIVNGGSLSYYHIELDDEDLPIKLNDKNPYSLNCLNWVVPAEYRAIVEHDTCDDSLC